MRSETPIYPVGERIKFFREKKALTVNKLANLAGLSQSHLRDIELKNKNPNVETIYLICKALGISLKEFFEDESTLPNFGDDPLFDEIYKLSPTSKDILRKFLSSLQA